MGIPISSIRKEPVFEEVIKMKYDVPNDNISMLDDLRTKIVNDYKALMEKYQ